MFQAGTDSGVQESSAVVTPGGPCATSSGAVKPLEGAGLQVCCSPVPHSVPALASPISPSARIPSALLIRSRVASAIDPPRVQLSWFDPRLTSEVLRSLMTSRCTHFQRARSSSSSPSAALSGFAAGAPAAPRTKPRSAKSSRNTSPRANGAIRRRVGALFTSDADQLVSSGEWRRGRDELVKGTLASSQRTGGNRTITLETIRFPTKRRRHRRRSLRDHRRRRRGSPDVVDIRDDA